MNQRGFIIPSPLMLVGGVALAFGISTLMFWRLYDAAVSDFASYKAQVEAANAQVQAENDRRLAEAAKATTEVAHGYDAAMGALARSHASRLDGLQRRASNCATVSLVAESARLPDGNTQDNRSDPAAPATDRYAETCERLERDAADATGQLIYLQSWVRKVCK